MHSVGKYFQILLSSSSNEILFPGENFVIGNECGSEAEESELLFARDKRR